MTSTQAQRPGGYTAEGEYPAAAMRQAFTGPTRDDSLDKLPTNHDYDGRALALIHEYQTDQPSSESA
jgi:hypothetical protein